MPTKESKGTWSCAVAITHLFEPERPIFGDDARQALQLALRFIMETLEAFEDRGGKLHWRGSREPIQLEELFP